jgi:regulatory protein
MKMDADESDQIIAHRRENFLNEERFACSFARGNTALSNGVLSDYE